MADTDRNLDDRDPSRHHGRRTRWRVSDQRRAALVRNEAVVRRRNRRGGLSARVLDGPLSRVLPQISQTRRRPLPDGRGSVSRSPNRDRQGVALSPRSAILDKTLKKYLFF